MAGECYTADFETTTDPEDCRVWAWGVCTVGDPGCFVHGNTIEGFVSWLSVHPRATVYFHNLAFDGAFLMDHLLNAGWRWTEARGGEGPRTFTTLISDMNQVYSMGLFFGKGVSVTILDSLKVCPLSIAQMAKAYGLPMSKGEIDYSEYREPGHVLTEEELDYLRRDVAIAAEVMAIFLGRGLDRMTAGSNALHDYMAMVGGKKRFRRVFPELEVEEDAFIRKAYRGGFSYVAPRFAGKVLEGGIVLDVNSLYPSVMAACEGQALPHGRPLWFDGEPPLDPSRPLWVASVTCMFRVREAHIPCIQLKGNNRFVQTEYVEDSMGLVTFHTTSVDWALITEQYDVRHVEWNGGYSFQASPDHFRPYVDRWVEEKNAATIEGNPGKRSVAKLMLNSLYGKFATRTTVIGRRPVMEDGVVRYVDLEPQERSPVYLPVGVFVTAWARSKTIRAAQSCYDRFVYADTDSLHLIGEEPPGEIDVDPVRLGAWKHESTWARARFIRAKCYTEEEALPSGETRLCVHVAGMPDYMHGQVNLDDFKAGAVYDGKLYQRRVPGGVVLVPGPMQIR